ncbi:MAG: hypothetical protein Q8M31_21765 [Beijerinckiaceae bacterium]|nr:hypothetical protein [Beijerinckiaceae bacterium]
MISEDDDWTDLEKQEKAGVVLPDAQVRMSRYAAGRGVKVGKARASIAFRRRVAEWLNEHGPRFRLQIGGADANKVRLIPDAAGGKFEFTMFRGTARMTLGHVSAWPDEVRDPVEAKASFDGAGNLVLSLPATFARPSPNVDLAAADLPRPPIAPMRQAPPQPFPITTSAPGLQRGVRGDVAVDLGEPQPGRSALDQRLATRADETKQPARKGVTLAGTRWGK